MTEYVQPLFQETTDPDNCTCNCMCQNYKITNYHRIVMSLYIKL